MNFEIFSIFIFLNLIILLKVASDIESNTLCQNV